MGEWLRGKAPRLHWRFNRAEIRGDPGFKSRFVHLFAFAGVILAPFRLSRGLQGHGRATQDETVDAWLALAGPERVRRCVRQDESKRGCAREADARACGGARPRPCS